MLRARTVTRHPATLTSAAALAAATVVLCGIAGLATACGGHAAAPVAVPSDVHLAAHGAAQALPATAVPSVTTDAPPAWSDGSQVTTSRRPQAPTGSWRCVP